MKRTLAVKKGERQLDIELDRLDVKYRKVKDLLAQALSHRHCFEEAAKAVGRRDGTCWCNSVRTGPIWHTQACDVLHVILYGGERGEQNGE